jgi:hypothetical protein
MKDTFDIIINKDGSIDAVYQDGLADALGAEETRICRVSNVEWEENDGKKGWTVRSAHSPSYCYLRRSAIDGYIEVTTNGHGHPAMFKTREDALEWEVKFFWELSAVMRKAEQPSTHATVHAYKVAEARWVEKGWEDYACPRHNVVGCMYCRYGTCPEPTPHDVPGSCSICHAAPGDPCDAGLHG